MAEDLEDEQEVLGRIVGLFSARVSKDKMFQ